MPTVFPYKKTAKEFNANVSDYLSEVEHLAEQLGLTPEQLTQQFEFEARQKEEGRQRFLAGFEKALSKDRAITQGSLKPIVLHWTECLHAELEKEWTAVKGNRTVWRNVIQRAFQNSGSQTDLGIVARVAIPSLVEVVFNGRQTKLTNLMYVVGKRVEEDLRYSRMSIAAREQWDNQYQKSYEGRHARKNKKAFVQRADGQMVRDGLIEMWEGWSNSECAYVGEMLITLFRRVSGIDFTFKREPTTVGNKTYHAYFRKLPDEWAERIEDNVEWLASLQFIRKPTLIPGKPFTSARNPGGYWSMDAGRNQSLIISKPDSRECVRRQRKKGVSPRVLRAINGMMATPFCVNEDVLELAWQLYKEVDSNGQPMKMQHGKWSIDANRYVFQSSPVVKKWPCAEMYFEKTEGRDDHDQERYNKEKEFHHRKDSENRVVPRMVLFNTLTMAEEMSKYDKFFMPYEFDFRGRAYAKPLLNPQKDDLNKGLLLLANKKPIGERGLYWLKFIVATLGEQDGIDKKHPDERVKWTEEHLPEIEAIAYNPLDCLEMWAQGDNRFQYYAACKELVNALTNPEGAEAYCSGFPIGFDGACSGMQHYSAMTLDEKSGRLVNLCDAERQDLYGYVANKVLEDINQLITEAKPNRIIIPRHKSGSEVIEEMEIEEASMAQHWLDSGLIGRSLVKANVMTYNYSSTRGGMKDQVIAKLKDYYENNANSNPFDEINQSRSAYANLLVNFSRGQTIAAAGKGSEVMEYVKTLVAKLGTHGLHPEHLIGKTPEQVAEINADIKAQALAHKQAMERWKANGSVKANKPVAPVLPQTNGRGNQGLYWETPDGFPVWQLTHKAEDERVEFTNLVSEEGFLRDYKGLPEGGKTTSLRMKKQTNVLNTRRNKSASSPDFIHSMDACHLRMTTNACLDEGITDFWYVHDQFSTVPADADGMHRIVREQFVQLYKYEQSMLVQLDAYAKANLPEKVYESLPPLPEKGNLNLDEVLKSTYAFI